MGKPKLLLAFKEKTVVNYVLDVRTSSRADEVMVVVRADDQPLLGVRCRWSVEVVWPETDPSDKNASLWVALEEFHEIKLLAMGAFQSISVSDASAAYLNSIA
jgi:CTP:molybdopterin cytidylyltransferase MocA